jgi:hypothetical protein
MKGKKKMRIFKSVLFLMIFSGLVMMADSVIKVPEMKTETLDVNGNKKFKIVKPVFINKVKFKDVNDELDRIININSIRDEEKEICVNDPERCGDYEVGVGPEVIYTDDKVISFTLNGYEYLGGAHGMSWKTAFLVDRKTGKLITDKLKTDNKAAFEKIQKYISNNETGIFFNDEYTVNELTESAVVYQTGKNTISIVYLSYAVAPYAAGMPEFEYNTKTKKLYFFDNFSGEKTEKREVK